jgi:hypothetical protein
MTFAIKWRRPSWAYIYLRKEWDMKTNDLVTIWGAPEPPRLTPKQVSIRVPILVSAKISALLDLFPRKTKTDIIGDLLTSALEKLDHELPMTMDPSDEHESWPQDGDRCFGYYGMRKDYFELVKKYLREMEKEADVKEPMEFSYPEAYAESDFKWE